MFYLQTLPSHHLYIEKWRDIIPQLSEELTQIDRVQLIPVAQLISQSMDRAIYLYLFVKTEKF